MKSLVLVLTMPLLATPALAGEVVISAGSGGQYQHLHDAVAAANADPDLSYPMLSILHPGFILTISPIRSSGR
jgi:glyoxylase-like metal-dependent hydrolase (beta-lactamase superfamily II)